MESDERSLAQPTLPVLVIADDPNLRERLGTILEGGGYPVVCTNSETNIERSLSSSGVAGIVSGAQKLGDLNATDFRSWLSQNHPDLSKRVVFLQKTFST